jgi:hypothetical protein
MATSEEIATAMSEFRAAAVAKGSAGRRSAQDDHAFHARMATAVEAFSAAGAAGANALRQLASDPSPLVRSWAASELLSQGELAMVPVLKELAEHEGLLGFNAQMVLQEYRAGRLGSPFGAPAP